MGTNPDRFGVDFFGGQMFVWRAERFRGESLCREHDCLVLFRGKVYVPLDAQLRHDIMEAHHDTPVTGHSGRWKTTELVGTTTGGGVWDMILLSM